MARKRHLAGTGALLVALLIACAALLLPHGIEAQAADVPGATHLGVASCAGSTCHGRAEASGAVVRQDEIRIWQEPSSPTGAHARAYAVLGSARGRAIATRMGVGEATSATACLGCHATPAAAGRRGPRFQLADGVGCEACHGAASGWIEAHKAVGANHSVNVARGLRALDDPRVRAATCLDCHYGSAGEGQFVTHRIMAAGHPRISFELDLFSALQQHHDEDSDYVARKHRSDDVKLWAVGQAVALDRSLSLFANPDRASEGSFPEFTFYDCHSCHRRIGDDPGFEPGAERNPGRSIPLGMPPFNDENMIMLSAAAKVVAPAEAQRFEAASRAFHSGLAANRAAAVRGAAALQAASRALADAFARSSIGKEQTVAIIDAIAGRAIAPRFTDYEGSVQAVMAVDTLLTALVNQHGASMKSATAIRPDIAAAYQAVRDPNAYRPAEFRAALGRAAAAIRRLS